MTMKSAVGDLSRNLQLRLAQANAKQRINRLTVEQASGVKADISQHLRGDLTRLSHMQTRLDAVQTWRENTTELGQALNLVQDSLKFIQDQANAFGAGLIIEAETADPAILQMRADAAQTSFAGIFARLNSELAGKFLFAGTRSDTPALADFDTFTTALNSHLAGATNVADVIARIDQWFDAPPGTGGFLDIGYLGGEAAGAGMLVDDNTAMGNMLTAADPEFRELFKGFAMLSSGARAAVAGNTGALRELVSAAGGKLHAVEKLLTVARAGVGDQQARVQSLAQRHDEEIAQIRKSRSDLIGADPYETAVALQEAETAMQTIYMMTARLSRLKLTDYL